jgi:penicillin-binding protein 1B
MIKVNLIRGRVESPEDRIALVFDSFVHHWPLLLLSLGILLSPLVLFIAVQHRAERIITLHRWTIPSTIYASAPILEKGQNLEKSWLVDYLQRMDYEETTTMPESGQYRITPGSVDFQNHRGTGNQDNPLVSVVLDKARIKKIIDMDSGKELPSYSLEAAPICDVFGKKWQKRELVSLKDVPPFLIDAVIAIEDHRFYSHHGIDIISVCRALKNDIANRNSLQGGSTITQQLAKNFYLSPTRSLKRKMNEAILALAMEQTWSKDKILELYLNEIYLGQQGAMQINGVGAASKFYFHKDVRRINLAEAAFLAGLIRAPGNYNPYNAPAIAKGRRNTVLYAMLRQQKIAAQQYQQAVETPLEVQDNSAPPRVAPYYTNFVTRQLLNEYPADKLFSQHFRVETTIDLVMQQAAEQALLNGLNSIDKYRYSKTHQKVQGCLIALDPKTGFVRAYVGGKEFSTSQFDRITQAFRQPGSSFKPFVYAEAIELNFQGIHLYNPATLISDEPIEGTPTSNTWEPHNYDDQYHEIVSLRTALANSLNVATANLAGAVGLDKIAGLAQNLGFKNMKPYPAISLGTFEVSPWQLIQAYTAFPNGGQETELQTIRRIEDGSGKTIYQASVRAKNVLHPQTAFLITDVLRTAITEGTGASSRRLGFTRPAAGKTGTSDDYKDGWFIGYTPNLICLVWVGYDDNTSLKMNAAQAALPIWVEFMKKATVNLPVQDFIMPSGIVQVDVDSNTGLLTDANTIEMRSELFIQGSQPVSDSQAEIIQATQREPVPERESDSEPVEDANPQNPQTQYIYFAAPESPRPQTQPNEVITQPQQ